MSHLDAESLKLVLSSLRCSLIDQSFLQRCEQGTYTIDEELKRLKTTSNCLTTMLGVCPNASGMSWPFYRRLNMLL